MQNQKLLRFLLIFTGVYVLLNVLYHFFLLAFEPQSDPLTRLIAEKLIHFFPPLSVAPLLFEPGMTLYWDGHPILHVKEGCNGLAVWFTVLAFLLAFGGKFIRLLTFGLSSFLIIQLGNFLRIILLVWIKMNANPQFEIFHVYFFPALLYALALALILFWVRLQKTVQRTTNNHADPTPAN